MPVFQVHVPDLRFSPEQKRALAGALPRALNEALGIPEEDQFVAITVHRPDELYLNPSYMGMRRSADAVIITVLFTAERPLADKLMLTQAICLNVVEVLRISGDDVFVALTPVPKENFSFGRGELQLATESHARNKESPLAPVLAWLDRVKKGWGHAP